MNTIKIEGIVQQGDKYGTQLGYPTANIAADTTAQDGVYIGFVMRGMKKHPAIIFVGEPTTLGQKGRRVESHILDFPYQELYGEKLEIQLASYLRGNQHFDSKEELLKAMKDDENKAREYFKKTKGN